MKELQESKAADEQEIDLLELAGKLWTNRRKIIVWSVVGAVIGLIVGFSIPKEYVSSAKLAPETGAARASGGFGALAAMAGFNGTSGNADAVNPELYPDVVGSIPFVTSLFNVEVETAENGQKMTLEQYMETLKAPWWSAIMKLPGKAIGLLKPRKESSADHVLDNFRLTENEYAMVQAISMRIQANVNQVNDVITISVRMQDPLVAALVADTVVSRLQEYITDYRTNKVRKDLAYAERINAEAQQEYYRAQKALADYSDRNQGLATNSARITRDRLTNEASLAFTLYNQTAQRVQAAKTMVQERTPVCAVVNPPTVPVMASSPRKMLILAGFIFLAAFACSVWILFVAPKIKSRKEAKANA